MTVLSLHRLDLGRLFIGLAILLTGVPVTADEGVYLSTIKPLLQAKCYACHGALKQESDVRLETRALMLKSKVIAPGKPDESVLLHRVMAETDERMPPEDEGAPLTADEVQLVRDWIQAGAPAPQEAVPPSPKEHWAFQPPVRPTVPTATDENGEKRNPIDALLATGRVQKNLTTVDTAARRLLLRRVYLDLVGLPPTQTQLGEFVDSPRLTYESVVDRLLSHPAHGERWARHWMDVWRYTDWYGLGAQVRYSQKHIWRWKEWIIESLNEDKAYNQMVMEMLAGDELAPLDQNVLRATGFLARNYFLFNRTTWLDLSVEHTAKAFLGLTLNCARCHDHKYDPLLQTDYYQMRAIFEPHQVRLDPVPGETNLDQDGLPRVFDNNPDVPTYLFVRGNDKAPDKDNPIPPGIPTIFGQKAFQPVSTRLPAEAFTPALQTFVLNDHLEKVERERVAAVAAVRAATAQLSLTEPTTQRPTTPVRGKVILRDDFTELSQERWIVGPGTWECRDGQLVQTKTGTNLERLFVRLRDLPPSDFEATCRLTITHDAGLRSVGFGFDAIDGRDKLVYISGGGQKAQLAHGSSPNYVYPSDAKKDLEIRGNQPYELTIRVRGTLINVALDGRHLLAYEWSVKRERGHLDLPVYDTSIAYDFVEVRTLPAEAAMVSVKPAVTRELAQARLEVAKSKLAAVQLRPDALRTAMAADRAKANGASAEEIQSSAKLATAADRAFRLAQAEAGLSEARAKRLEAAPDKQAAADQAIVQAQANVDVATKATTAIDTAYTSVYVSRRAANGQADEKTGRHGPYSPTTTGRRTALAKWIANRQNPLTARVAVNHIWSRHFGQPLVPSMTDFGLRTPRPLQHALLDWLAVELMENAWSMKHIHRLIVTSNAYRLGSSTKGYEANLAIDPENEFYWRRRPQRMESQQVRDSLLHLAGTLDERLGGPDLDPATDNSVHRRGLYFRHSRDSRSYFLTMFDDADILHCYRRKASVVPQQALAMSNGQLTLQSARTLAQRIRNEAGHSGAAPFVDAAFETLLCLRPTDEERDACLASLALLEAHFTKAGDKAPHHRAQEGLVHALMNHNDFITIR